MSVKLFKKWEATDQHLPGLEINLRSICKAKAKD